MLEVELEKAPLQTGAWAVTIFIAVAGYLLGGWWTAVITFFVGSGAFLLALQIWVRRSFSKEATEASKMAIRDFEVEYPGQEFLSVALRASLQIPYDLQRREFAKVNPV